MNGKRFSENKARRNGFYLALAVCLVAVGVAAWSTFDAVQGYMTAANSDPTASEGSAGKTSRPSEDPEAPRTPAPTARPSVGAGQTQAESQAKTPAESPDSVAKPAATPAPAATPQPTASPAPAAQEEQAREEETAQEPQETPPQPVNAPLYEISEEMVYPVLSKEVAKAYSAGAPVYSATMKDWRIHVGTDLSAESGEQVFACGNGIVRETYSDSMLGNVVVIEHGDYDFYYCGLGENFLVEPGDVVSMGQAIGSVTAVPEESADQVHLHLEVRRDSTYLDPQSVIEGID